MIRNWGLPFFALWALLGPVLGSDTDSFAVRAVSTGLLLSLAVAIQRALGVVIDRTRSHMQSSGGRSAPERHDRSVGR